MEEYAEGRSMGGCGRGGRGGNTCGCWESVEGIEWLCIGRDVQKNDRGWLGVYYVSICSTAFQNWRYILGIYPMLILLEFQNFVSPSPPSFC